MWICSQLLHHMHCILQMPTCTSPAHSMTHRSYVTCLGTHCRLAMVSMLCDMSWEFLHVCQAVPCRYHHTLWDRCWWTDVILPEIMRASRSDWQHLLKFEHCMRSATMNLDVFVQTAWAHLDIAGAAWDHNQKLATGFGASTLAEWAISQGQ